MALGKEMLQKFYFFKKIFAEGNGMALGKGPFFAEVLGHSPRQRSRNLNFVFCFLHSIDTSISDYTCGDVWVLGIRCHNLLETFSNFYHSLHMR